MNLEDYYTQYIPKLKRYAEYLTHDTHEAHDLIQETFERAIRFPYDPTKGKGVYGYLTMLMKSTFLHGKDKENAQYANWGEELSLDELGFRASYDPWAGINQSIDLREKLEKMPLARRELAILFIQGYTLDEIYPMLNLPRSTVHWHLYKIKQELL